jgi:hypothetical protein
METLGRAVVWKDGTVFLVLNKIYTKNISDLGKSRKFRSYFQ